MEPGCEIGQAADVRLCQALRVEPDIVRGGLLIYNLQHVIVGLLVVVESYKVGLLVKDPCSVAFDLDLCSSSGCVVLGIRSDCQ